MPLVEPVPLQELHRLAATSTRIGLQHIPNDLGRLDRPLEAGAVYNINLHSRIAQQLTRVLGVLTPLLCEGHVRPPSESVGEVPL
jgi:hypothetical protein